MKVSFVGEKLSLKLKRVVKKAFKKTIKELEQVKNLAICLNMVSEDEIKKLNNDTRGVDKVTDVLSFPSFEISPFDKVQLNGGKNVFIGDIAICKNEVKRQMIEYNESEKRVFARLIIHSILHLLGFDHIKDEDYEVMEPVQNKILNIVVKK